MNIISFTQPNMLQKVLLGEKTQTRREWKPKYLSVIDQNGDNACIVPKHMQDYLGEDSTIEMWTAKNTLIIHSPSGSVNGKAHWAVGGVNTVTGGRGKPAVWFKENAVEGVARYSVVASKPQGFGDEGVLWSSRDERESLTEKGYQPLKIRVTRLRVEDVRLISDEDAKAEGFNSYIEFMTVWRSIHDKSCGMNLGYWEYKTTRDIADALIKYRPAERYKAVVIDFEVAR